MQIAAPWNMEGGVVRELGRRQGAVEHAVRQELIKEAGVVEHRLGRLERSAKLWDAIRGLNTAHLRLDG